MKKLNWAIVVSILSLLLSAFVGLAPYAQKQLSPEKELVFEKEGPIAMGDLAWTLGVQVSNNGSTTAKDVKVQMTGAHIWRPKNGKLDEVVVWRGAQVLPVTRDGSNYVVALGNLVPGDVAKISVLAPDFFPGEVRVRADDMLAHEKPTAKQSDWLGDVLFSLAVMVTVLAALAIGDAYLVSPEYKRKRYLELIDKLPKAPSKAGSRKPSKQKLPSAQGSAAKGSAARKKPSRAPTQKA